MFAKHLGPFFYPPEVGGGEGNPGELEQDLADLGEEPVKPEEEGSEEESEEESSEEEGSEEEEGEEESEEEGVEGEEEEEPGKDGKKVETSGRPTIKDIKTFDDGKYKDFFKDFPDVRKAYYQVAAFQEVFADPQEAQTAASKAAEFDTLETALVDEGDPTVLLKTLAENNPKALKKMVGNFATSLRSVEPEVYTTLTTPIIEELLFYASKHAEKIGNKNLGIAAKHIANFVFNNGGDIPDISKRAPAEPTEAEKQLKTERETYAKEKLEGALQEVGTAASDTLSRILNQGVEELTSFEKRSLIRDARDEINTTLKNDKQLQRQLTTLWDAAKKANYSPAAKERIKTAWLSRAKQVAPAVRNRLKQEALDARTGEEASDKTKTKTKGKRTFPAAGGAGGRGGASRVLDPSKIDWRKTSDADILEGNDKVTLKK